MQHGKLSYFLKLKIKFGHRKIFDSFINFLTIKILKIFRSLQYSVCINQLGTYRTSWQEFFFPVFFVVGALGCWSCWVFVESEDQEKNLALVLGIGWWLECLGNFHPSSHLFIQCFRRGNLSFMFYFIYLIFFFFASFDYIESWFLSNPG